MCRREQIGGAASSTVRLTYEADDLVVDRPSTSAEPSELAGHDDWFGDLTGLSSYKPGPAQRLGLAQRKISQLNRFNVQHHCLHSAGVAERRHW
jgi:hypothetical protein